MTPGQRWTSGLALVLVILIVLFGAPTRRLVSPQRAQEREAGRGSTLAGSRTAPTSQETSLPSTSTTTGSSPGRADTADQVTSAATPPPSPGVDLNFGPGPSPPHTVALVPPADSSTAPTGRTEADVARVFVDEATYPLSVVEVPSAAEHCSEIRPHDVALLSASVGDDLRDCLVERGSTVVAFDADGDRPPEGGRPGQVVSTRRGTSDTLVDMATWGASGALQGKVGLVTMAGDREAMSTAVPELREMGIDVQATAYLDDSAASTSEEVRSFVEDGVEVVLFAAPVEQQRRWASQHAILDRAVRFVVSDAHDGVREETYPPAFDGALAHTSLRMPWFSREHGETDEQAGCRGRWEENATPPTTLGDQELRWVYEWCQHVDLVGRAAQDFDGERPMGSLLRDVRLASPLTSDLGPLTGEAYGPTEDAVLVWRAPCSCWEEQRGFEPRDGS